MTIWKRLSGVLGSLKFHPFGGSPAITSGVEGSD